METFQQIKESGLAPNEFWYLATLILTAILVIFMAMLIFFVKGFFSELKTTIKELVDSVGYLKNLATAYGADITQLKKDVGEAQDDIKALEKRRR